MSKVPSASATRAVSLCAAAVLALATAACTSSGHPKPPAAGTPSAPSSTVATRWWSNSAVAAGSTISAADPSAAAGTLGTSRTDYCGMLSDTLKSNKSILSANSTSNPRLVTSAKAFVAEIEAVAPTAVTADWRVIGPVIIQLEESGAVLPSGSTVENAANVAAAEAINNDSKRNCGLDLSSVITGG